MITKLTAENAELYYAPRFAEITAAFQAAGQDIEIKSLEDYFLHLTEIAALQVGAKDMPEAFLLVLPADEEIFTIDANSRAINVPAFVKKNGIGVYGDHRAEMIVMTIDRYFDHEDFLNDKIVINWNFTPAGAKTPFYEENQAAAAFAPNEELNPGLITFGFIITKDMTPQKGTLTFSVTIYDEESGTIVYSFNTLTATVNINDTLTLTNPSIIKDDTSNYVGRLVNSVYTDNTISPVDTPEWKSGEKISKTEFSGLDAVAYFSSSEDLANVYTKGALLTAYATSDNTSNIVYKWTFNPLDGTVETAREFETINKNSDYVEVDELVDNGEIYYVKDVLGNIKTSEPLTYEEAKALQDSADTGNFLPLKVKKLETIPQDPSHTEDWTFNQEHLKLNVSGNLVISHSDEALRSFESTNPSQGSGEWIGFDIDTGLDSIVGVTWNGYALTEDDVLEAASVGLGAGHIVFWAKADVISVSTRSINITAEGYDPTYVSFSHIGVKTDEEAPSVDGELIIVNSTDEVVFVVRGSSYRALSAGNYQVVAQARISAGEKYEQVLEGATLKVGTEYFVKVDGEIDKNNPLVNGAAQAAQAEGKELYVRIGAARNSVPIESSVLRVPPAVRPEVTLSVASEFQFDDAVTRDEESEYANVDYVYIDSTQIPEIVATVAINSDDARDKAGAFAAELVQTSEAELTLEAIEQKIADEDLKFVAFPEDGKFIFRPEEIEEGEYVVRAINRRNGTYSVSENSDSINTSFVAPSIVNIDVKAIFDNRDPINALIHGSRPESGIENFEINKNNISYNFELVDHSENFADAVVTYYIEEVEYDESTGIVSSRVPNEYGNDPETGRPYEYYGQEDVRKIEPIQDENDNTVYRFSIVEDPGYYRIKTVNRYHGTIHTSYTDIFGIITH